MSFLKRFLGGAPKDRGATGADAATDPAGPGEPALDEIERDRALLREDAQRLDDDLIQRQLRYARWSWTPPAEGGARRSGDSDGPAG